MDDHNRRICVCYVITALLVSSFIYALLASNAENAKSLKRLREDVNEVSKLLGAPSTDSQSKQLSDIVETMLKKRLGGIWDDIYSMKKQLKAVECQKPPEPATCPDVPPAVTTTTPKPPPLVTVVPRTNYAAAQAGARIASVEGEPAAGSWFLQRCFRLDYSANPPINMLRQSMEPGNCFAFMGTRATVTIMLSNEIVVDTIELEHVAASKTPPVDTTSAPRAFSVYGICQRDPNQEFLFGHFIYNNSAAKRAQQFTVTAALKYRYVRFKFHSNYGLPKYTCVYRVGVFGRP